MKFEQFNAGAWRQQFQYKSFSPIPVNRQWSWEEPAINALLEKAKPTANALVRDFQRLNILKEVSGAQRYRVFVFERYLNLFSS